jgi:hypothetical protein
MRKEGGGLGIPDLRDLNLTLLGSWVKRFIRDEDKNLALSDKKENT